MEEITSIGRALISAAGFSSVLPGSHLGLGAAGNILWIQRVLVLYRGTGGTSLRSQLSRKVSRPMACFTRSIKGRTNKEVADFDRRYADSSSYSLKVRPADDCMKTD